MDRGNGLNLCEVKFKEEKKKDFRLSSRISQKLQRTKRQRAEVL